MDFDKTEQHSERFLSVNPNGRIPALIDRERGVTVTESGAILEYCASAYWPNVDISAMTHLRDWIAMLHQRPSFSTGLTIPFFSTCLLRFSRCSSSGDRRGDCAQRRSDRRDVQTAPLSSPDNAAPSIVATSAFRC